VKERNRMREREGVWFFTGKTGVRREREKNDGNWNDVRERKFKG